MHGSLSASKSTKLPIKNEMTSFRFEILHTSKKSSARVGRLYTPHGMIDTPNFVAVGTHGTIKSLDNEMVKQIGLQLMFCNTYHLILQPGIRTIQEAGGLHAFIHRDLPIITDSGGFQVFSLSYGSVTQELKSKGMKKKENDVLKINDQGVLFRSYRDGSKVWLTPESSVQAQKAFGADIIIPLDELPPYHLAADRLLASLERTHDWEKRSLDTHLKEPNGQAMYGVIHGGIDRQLRKQSACFLSKLPFNGFAIGGSLGKTKQEMLEMLSFTLPYLPEKAPNHLLGIADLDSLESCIPLGIDTFDSSYPTKAARHGSLLTQKGVIKVTRGYYKNHFQPPDCTCSCLTCQHYTLAYLHHLFKAREATGMTLASIHNLHFMVEFMKQKRKAIYADLI